MIWLILLVDFCVLNHGFAQVFETEFNLCPKEYRYAFQNGAKCCHGFNKTEGDCSGIELKRYSNCCLENSIDCPTGSDCEDCKYYNVLEYTTL